MKRISLLLTLAITLLGFNIIGQAGEFVQSTKLNSSSNNVKELCQFIYDHYPATQFCLPIYNDLDVNLNIQKQEGAIEVLGPKITYVIFKPEHIKRMGFHFSIEGSTKIIYLEGKSDVGIQCFKTKEAKGSFRCKDWF